MAFRATVLTLYPEMFPGPLGKALAGRALDRKIWTLDVSPIRNFAQDKHRSVDDSPAGGGAGMVMRPDVLARAIDAAPQDCPRILLSAKGRSFSQKDAAVFSQLSDLVLICGRFEGVDERVIAKRGLIELSVGDYILSGGETAAMIVLDAVVRLLPGVMGNALSGAFESFENHLLEHPHYTRPQIFENCRIPDVLTSGNHQAVEEWRKRQSEEITKERRPDLYEIYQKTKGRA